ncbi:MAG: iron-containing alcohol dehydrogenase [Erysipelotrichaceae bacterium]|nr:iron-containing alcohol dehydrogenase [Erysipelotrichaceae bacterium]
MENYTFFNPTKIVFGKGSTNKLKELITDYNNIMFMYGGKSLKASGLYDRIIKQLDGKRVLEYPGIKPNPLIDDVRKAVDFCKENNVEFILGVGGGSVMDSAKLVASGALYDGDVWDFLEYREKRPEKALPVGTIVTLAGTGSETNNSFVATEPETLRKIGKSGSEINYPKFAICDPENTYTVSAYQTASGSFDTISHVFEHYFWLPEDYTPIQDGFEEGVMRAVIHDLPIALKEPDNYEARANLLMASEQALFGLADVGKGYGEHVEHKMEHILSAKYNCAHGAGLAVVVPAYRRFMCAHDPKKYRQFAKNVFDIDTTGMSDYEAGIKGIEKLEEFIRQIGLPSTLKELGAQSKDDVDLLTEALCENGWIFKNTIVTKEDIRAMYASVYE